MKAGYIPCFHPIADSPMPVTHFITHHFRTPSEAQAGSQLAANTLEGAEIPLELVDELKGTYLSRLSMEYGSFEAEAEASPLMQGLDAFLAGEDDFTTMTQQLLQSFESMLKEQELGLDRYVVCFKEKSADIENVYLVFLTTKTVFGINGDLSTGTSECLDVGPSLFGIKVNIREWKHEKNYAYLSFVAPRSGKDLGAAFETLTGFSKGIDKKADTSTFLKGVEAFAEQVPEDQVNDYRAQVVDYCLEQDQRHEPVSVRELAMSVDAVDGDRFSQFMEDYSPLETTGGLRVDRQSLRRYVRFQGRERDLAISFSSHQLNNRVHYNPDTDTISISGIPKALRRQLVEHLGG